MSQFDPSQLAGLFGQGGLDPAKLQEMAGPIMQMIQDGGGLQGLLEKLQAGGMAEQVQSWLGSGANLPIDPSQITQALGPDTLGNIASQTGQTVEQVSGSLSSALPDVVNQMSPGGSLPSADQLAGMLQQIPGGDQLGGLLGGLLGGGTQ